MNPLVLGAGQPLFRDVDARVSLTLVSARSFGSDNVVLTYAPR